MKPNRPAFKQIITILGMAVLLPMSMAHAQPAPSEHGGHGGHCRMADHDRRGGEMEPRGGMAGNHQPVPPFLRGIELTEAQNDAIFKLMHDQAPIMRDKEKSLRKAHEALHAMVRSGKYDETKAGALAQEIADSSGALSLLRARAEHEIYSLLTPEQRKKVNEAKDREDFRPAGDRATIMRPEARRL